ncbi:hypothetical protein BZA05DRAFT_465698 [Tricharina praecox]|uniref:uncharacterized protein n=1 Tax=Tricharina praecox TaxID=43433 RepID=UPI00221FE628|nr:uncharacterized protein BZA05DRAFT_466533 [Tricharina praecox]XP_051334572.1 uncharacterized protein BZA05DRAFT_465698 [Tricharina praecox]KAI5840878.1 hypothetical protein BZA05DRAFT_466533 [Tricharina praecox]KAI5840919.1 hypothetical protein BZA05DRAFT_465698 [Tricharina praecox]
MRSHKESADDHAYCRLHNIDFRSWEEHCKHRVLSRGHFTCHICYKDFKSQRGLAIHADRVHKPIEYVTYFVCRQTLKGSKNGLTMHSEKNCRGGMAHGDSMHQNDHAMRPGAVQQWVMDLRAMDDDGFPTQDNIHASQRSVQPPTITQRDMGGDGFPTHHRSNSYSTQATGKFPTQNYNQNNHHGSRPGWIKTQGEVGGGGGSGGGFLTHHARNRVDTTSTASNRAANDLGIAHHEMYKYFNQVHGKYICPCGSKMNTYNGLWQHLEGPAHTRRKAVGNSTPPRR